MASTVRNLQFRNGRYYARLGVPAKLRPYVGQSELVKALDADRRIAERMLPGVIAQFYAKLDDARARAGLISKRRTEPVSRGFLTPQQIALDHYAAQLSLDEAARNSDHRFSHGFIDQDHISDLRAVISGRASNDEMARTVGRLIQTYRNRGNTGATTGTVEWREIARALAVAELEGLARTAERDDGDFTGRPSNPILTEPPKAGPTPVSAADPLATRMLGPDSRLPLKEIVPRFLAERQISASSQNEHQVSVRMFDEFLGESKPAYQITRRDVLAYKSALLELPSNYVKRFPGLTLPAAIKANKERVTPYPALDPRTVNDKWLSNLRALLHWCSVNDIIPDNPAANVKAAFLKDKGKPDRVPFDPADLTKIFGHSTFDRSKPWGETQWAYLLSLYCGTRPSELAQVKLDSVRHERGILVLRIQEETKNTGSQRAIPIHTHLERLGFTAYVEALRARRETHLFPKWYRDGQRAYQQAREKADKEGKPVTLDKHYPKFIPRRFNVTFKKNVGIHDSRKDFYGFRHTFKTGLAQAGVVKDVRDSLTGHVDSSPGAVYVHDVSLEMLKEAIELLRFDGLPDFDSK